MDQKKVDTTREDVSLVDVLKLFRGKLKILVCVMLITAILGSVAGVFITESDIVYGAEIIFYLDPHEETSKDLLPLLRSDAFAEKLLLDENGLPPEDECDPDQYSAALAAVEAEKAARETKIGLSKQITAYPYEFAKIEEKYNSLRSECTRLSDLLKTYKSAQDGIGNTPEHKAQMEEYERLHAEAEAAMLKYKAEQYDPAMETKLQLEQDYFTAKRDYTEARKTAAELVEKLVCVWREKEDVRALIATIEQSVTYQYTTEVQSSADAQSIETPNVSFLVISVSVPQDKELAEKIVTLVKERTPEFVEKEIERLTGAAEASCTLTSTFAEAKEISGTSLVKNVILFGLIGMIGGLVVTSAVIITKGFLPEDLFEKKEKKTKKNKKDAEAAQ